MVNEQFIRQKCLILRPELQLQIILLDTDFLIKNSVGISYDDLSCRMTIKINKEVIQLLSDKMETNLNHYYPTYFLANSEITEEKSEDSVTPKNPVNYETPSKSSEEQINVNEFFRLDPDCQMLNINSFLQACNVAKEKYLDNREVDLIAYSVPPTNLDYYSRSWSKKS